MSGGFKWRYARREDAAEGGLSAIVDDVFSPPLLLRSFALCPAEALQRLSTPSACTASTASINPLPASAVHSQAADRSQPAIDIMDSARINPLGEYKRKEKSAEFEIVDQNPVTSVDEALAAGSSGVGDVFAGTQAARSHDTIKSTAEDRESSDLVNIAIDDVDGMHLKKKRKSSHYRAVEKVCTITGMTVAR